MPTIEEQLVTLQSQNSALVSASNALTGEITGKMAAIDARVGDAADEFANFMNASDGRYITQPWARSELRVDGDQNQFYPVRITKAEGHRFFIRRTVHMDSDFYGAWNGGLEFAFRAAHCEYGASAGYIHVDSLFVHGKSSSRILPDADIPFVGRLSTTCGPYDIWVWLRGNTTYYFGSESSNVTAEVIYVPLDQQSTYEVAESFSVTDGVHPSVPTTGYIRGES